MSTFEPARQAQSARERLFAEQWRFTGTEPPLITAEELRRWVVHEDTRVIVFNKPGWVVCHPSKRGPWSSLVGAAREAWNTERLHLVARLDRETSGVVILAKHRAAASELQRAFQERRVSKQYLCVLTGELVERVEVSRPLADDSQSAVASKQAVVDDYSGFKAQTSFVPLATGGGYTLTQAIPHTGRKHQIRAHALWLGFPVAGDKLYGPDEGLFLTFAENGWLDAHAAALPLLRQALHAHEVAFDFDAGGCTYRAHLPDDLAAFCESVMGLRRSWLAERGYVA